MSRDVTDRTSPQWPDRWWYVKLYHDPGVEGAATDRLLLTCIGALTSEWLAQHAIDGFFFLRYFDRDGHHLRLRAHLCDPGMAGLLSAGLSDRVRAEPSPVRLASATYEPEIDKYGGRDAMLVVERHFSISSQLAIDCVGRTIDRGALRVLIAACTFDRLLELAAIDGACRATLLTAYRDHWDAVHAELTGEVLALPSVSDPLTRWWRDVKNGTPEARADATELVGSIFPVWERSTAGSIGQLAALAGQGQLTTQLESIVCNMAHTFHNRLGLSVRDEVITAALMLSQP